MARAADEAGLEQMWLWEDCFLASGVAMAAAALAWTERLQVGIGLLPVPLRNVALTAMEIAALHRLFPGRVHVGVGHGVQEWMGQVGAGEEVSTEGRYVRLDRVALDWPPLGPAAVLSGATGPRSMRLSGELAAGTILTGGTGPGGVRSARLLLDEARAAAGRAGSQPVTVVLQPTADDPDPEGFVRFVATEVRPLLS